MKKSKLVTTLLVIFGVMLSTQQSHAFIEVPNSLRLKLRGRQEYWHPRLAILEAKSEFLDSDINGGLNYGMFKRLVETRNSESGSLNSGQTDIKTINKMTCACTFKKLFVNTIEAGLPNLNIGKDHGKKIVKKIVPTDVHIYINEKKKKKKKQVQQKIKHLFDYQPMLIQKGEKPQKIVKKLSHPLSASKRRAFLEYKRIQKIKKQVKKPIKKKLVKKPIKAAKKQPIKKVKSLAEVSEQGMRYSEPLNYPQQYYRAYPEASAPNAFSGYASQPGLTQAPMTQVQAATSQLYYPQNVPIQQPQVVYVMAQQPQAPPQTTQQFQPPLYQPAPNLYAPPSYYSPINTVMQSQPMQQIYQMPAQQVMQTQITPNPVYRY